MASANEPADVRIVVEDVNGNQAVVQKFRSDSAIHAGKSPDGVLANLTTDKQVKLPINSGRVATGGEKIRCLINLDAASGIDVSDGVFLVAVTEDSGQEYQLSAADFGISTDLPAALVAGTWIELGTGFEVPNNKRLMVGSRSGATSTVFSLEDDS